jgi:hypothetical protein
VEATNDRSGNAKSRKWESEMERRRRKRKEKAKAATVKSGELPRLG